jgi:hypothetical protein
VVTDLGGGRFRVVLPAKTALNVPVANVPNGRGITYRSDVNVVSGAGASLAVVDIARQPNAKTPAGTLQSRDPFHHEGVFQAQRTPAPTPVLSETNMLHIQAAGSRDA